MRKLVLSVLVGFLMISSASAQYYAIPEGAVLPDGGIHFGVPMGVPFTARTNTCYHLPCMLPGLFYPGTGSYGAPIYPVAYPFVEVPMQRSPLEGMRSARPRPSQ